MAARASRIPSVIGALALATLLASCATGAEVDEESVGASTTPSPTAEPTPEPTTFTTQNGTASFALPHGWTVEDTSAMDWVTNHGGPAWQNWVSVLDADGVPRARYGDGYADDVGAASERRVVQSIDTEGGLHAAAWWSTAGDGAWQVEAAVVQDTSDPYRSIIPDGYDRLHSFSGDLAAVPECASVVDEATAVACLEAPGTTEVLELLATLELQPLPWDAMPDGVDPQADAPWVDFVSADGAVRFSHPESWSLMEHDPASGAPGDTFATLLTPDGFQALVVRLSTVTPQQSWCERAPGDEWMPFTTLSSEGVDLVTDPALAPEPLELTTFALDSGAIGVAVLPVDRVAAGCFDPTIAQQEGFLAVSTPWSTDATGLIYDRFPAGAGFVGSYEHDVMLEVARSVTMTL